LLHLSDRWKAGGIYTFPLPPPTSLLLPQWLSLTEQQQALISLLHWCSSISQTFLVISPSKLERKGSKTRLERRSTDFQSLRAFGSRFDRWLYLLLLELCS
jgi:hypothetical protein